MIEKGAGTENLMRLSKKPLESDFKKASRNFIL
jgi:hypothetical protein